jgi:hypothetical protein
MGTASPNIDRLLHDLKRLITTLQSEQKYFDVHLVGKNGTLYVNVEHEVGTYHLRAAVGPGPEPLLGDTS